MGSFKLTVRKEGDLAIFSTDGYINNLGAEKIAEGCYKHIETGCRKFLLDLEESPIINSIGVSILIEVIEKLQEVNGHIGYYNMAPIVAKTFKIMGLDKYSTLYDSEEEAIEGMKNRTSTAEKKT